MSKKTFSLVPKPNQEGFSRRSRSEPMNHPVRAMTPTKTATEPVPSLPHKTASEPHQAFEPRSATIPASPVQDGMRGNRSQNAGRDPELHRATHGRTGEGGRDQMREGRGRGNAGRSSPFLGPDSPSRKPTKRARETGTTLLGFSRKCVLNMLRINSRNVFSCKRIYFREKGNP